MFERFTDRSRRVVVLAQENARLLEFPAIDTEHILLGLAQEGEGVAAQVLDGLGLDYKSVLREVVACTGEVLHLNFGQYHHLPFTMNAKKTLEFSLREALTLGHNYIGTEHILLGLIRLDAGLGAEVLKGKTDLATARSAVIEKLGSYE